MELAHMLTRIHITTIKKADKAYAVLNLFFLPPKRSRYWNFTVMSIIKVERIFEFPTKSLALQKIVFVLCIS